MRAQLSYRPREGIVSGVVAGRLVRLPTRRDQARIMAWEKQQELRPGKVTLWDHVFESPHPNLERAGPLAGTSPLGPAGPKLTVAENATLEIYDWPGAYAQRFDGVDKGGGSGRAPPNHHRYRGSAVYVRGHGGFCLHGMPPCGNPRCIVVTHDWDFLFKALKQTRQLTIVVEL
jgi:hypothetical protein